MPTGILKSIVPITLLSGHAAIYEATISIYHIVSLAVSSYGQEKVALIWISGDGDCVIDVVKSNAVPSAIATGLELQAAAFSLLNECVMGQNGQAGIIKGIELDVPHLRVYSQKCDATANCKTIGMPAAISPKRSFGRPLNFDLDYVLPTKWDSRCEYGVRISQGPRN
ncbi:MAG: hypothetical protein Q9195_006516 [Heterodermia aff. obscurata]